MLLCQAIMQMRAAGTGAGGRRVQVQYQQTTLHQLRSVKSFSHKKRLLAVGFFTTRNPAKQEGSGGKQLKGAYPRTSHFIERPHQMTKAS